MRTLVFDPSGNFSDKEGKGTTGWALFVDGELKDFGDIAAEGYNCLEHYWYAHVDLMQRLDIHHVRGDEVLCESFKLFAHKSKQQSWSGMETSQLIGYLRMWCWDNAIPFKMQEPRDKIRVADEQLVHMGYLEKRGNKHYCLGRPTNLHMRDAIRHGIYYFRYGKGRTVPNE